MWDEWEDTEERLYKNVINAYSRNDEWSGLDQYNARTALEEYREADSYQGGA